MKLVTYHGPAHILEVKDPDGDMWFFPKNERQAVPDGIADLIIEHKDVVIEDELVLDPETATTDTQSPDPFSDHVQEEE